MVGGNVGPTKLLRKDGYYWLNLNFTEPDVFVFKGCTVKAGSDPPRYKASRTAGDISAKTMLNSKRDSYLANMFVTTGISYTSNTSECPAESDIPEGAPWTLAMKIAGCHVLLKSLPTVEVASNITRKVC